MRLLVACGFAVISLFLLSGTGLGNQPVVSLDELDARISAAIRIAEEHQASPRPRGMSLVRKALSFPVEVEVGGELVTIPKDSFIESLSGSTSEDFRSTSEHLGVLQQQVRAAFTPAPGPEESRIGAALARSFDNVQQAPPFFRRIARTIAQALAAVIAFLLELIGNVGAPAAVVALIGLAVLFAAMLYFVFRNRLTSDRVIRMKVGSGQQTDWAARAEDAMRRGDWNEAVRARYMAIVEELVRLEIVRDRPSLTAGECRRAALSARIDISPMVERATTVFENVAYALEPLREADLEVLEKTLAVLQKR